MTKEEKSLLIQDLSARLPYGVKGFITYDDDKNIFTIKGIFNILFLSDTECCHIEDFKPYLRPMSSMTEEEWEEYDNFCDNCRGAECFELIDWLNAHHFDYRGLIEKDLAIEAPKDMYNLKEK